MSETNTNTTDATRGQLLKTRVQTRRRELQIAASRLPPTHHTRQDIEAALAAVAGLLTGDLEHIPQTVAADLSQWLERNKYLGEQHGPAPTPAAEPTELTVEESPKLE